jgi:lipopolysaccharide biosynthesis glycosyltransferase
MTVFVLACDDKYLPFTAVAARRIARYATEKFPIIVVSDGVSDENKALAQKFCSQISFIEAASVFGDRELPVNKSFSRAAYLRLFLDEILSDFDRVVYLDSDISPLADISPLLAVTPKSAPIIAAHDLHVMMNGAYRERLKILAPYFNSGVMVLDLKAIRAERLFATALQYAIDHPERCPLADQDALNAVLNGRWQTLDWRWNCLNYMNDRLPKQPFIRHFAGSKPWLGKKAGIERRFAREWGSDLAESPWPERFHEQPFTYRALAVLRPTMSAVEHFAKSLVYSRSAGRRGKRARLADNFSEALSEIEQSAAAGSLADFVSYTRI